MVPCVVAGVRRRVVGLVSCSGFSAIGFSVFERAGVLGLISILGLLGLIWQFRCVSHEEDSLLSSGAPRMYVAMEISLHSHRKGLSPFKQKKRETDPRWSSAKPICRLRSLALWSYLIIAIAPQTIACYNCPLDEGLCLYQE
jgi:hypothetical protein